LAQILVVDDDPIALLLLTRGLTQAGHEVVAVTDGQQALNVLARQQFDLVVTDILMPIVDGIEVIRRLARDYPGTPVLATSGGGEMMRHDYLPIAQRLGAHAVLPKPFTAEQLVQAVAALLAVDESGTKS
jgi:CheY-like chemotaxis protein